MKSDESQVIQVNQPSPEVIERFLDACARLIDRAAREQRPLPDHIRKEIEAERNNQKPIQE